VPLLLRAAALCAPLAIVGLESHRLPGSQTVGAPNAKPDSAASGFDLRPS
jgi:hypothetical protein